MFIHLLQPVLVLSLNYPVHRLGSDWSLGHIQHFEMGHDQNATLLINTEICFYLGFSRDDMKAKPERWQQLCWLLHSGHEERTGSTSILCTPMTWRWAVWEIIGLGHKRTEKTLNPVPNHLQLSFPTTGWTTSCSWSWSMWSVKWKFWSEFDLVLEL